MLIEKFKPRLVGVHHDLVAVVERAAAAYPLPFDLMVIEGLRSPERQAALVKAGASQTLRSRHLTGHAVDLGAFLRFEDKDDDGKDDDGLVGLRWDWPLYDKIAHAMKTAAKDLSVVVEWGGDWQMRDGPHFQLPWSLYPIRKETR